MHISAKFTQDTVKSELASAGLVLENFFTDDHCLFGLVVTRHAGRWCRSGNARSIA